MTTRVDDKTWYENNPWMQTYSGIKFHFNNPAPEEIKIDDIAHALSLQCRYGGHCNKFYSVAEHCVHVSNYCSSENAFWGLMHDASEAYLVDICRPVKAFLTNYKQMEEIVMKAIADKYDLQLPIPDEVHKIDSQILFNEKQLLSPVDWGWKLDPLPNLDLRLPWDPIEAEFRFLRRFKQLYK